MWMVDPKIMCTQHLKGEHLELHMLNGTLRLKRKVTGFVTSNAIELTAVKERHDAIVAELATRPDKFNHNTPIAYVHDTNYLPAFVLYYKVDKGWSRTELLRRCSKCRERLTLTEV